MRAVTKVYFLDESGEKFFGEGPCRLLHGVEQTGSLRAASSSGRASARKKRPQAGSAAI